MWRIPHWYYLMWPFGATSFPLLFKLDYSVLCCIAFTYPAPPPSPPGIPCIDISIFRLPPCSPCPLLSAPLLILPLLPFLPLMLPLPLLLLPVFPGVIYLSSLQSPARSRDLRPTLSGSRKTHSSWTLGTENNGAGIISIDGTELDRRIIGKDETKLDRKIFGEMEQNLRE